MSIPLLLDHKYLEQLIRLVSLEQSFALYGDFDVESKTSKVNHLAIVDQ
ncbi:hypothetical protein B4144_2139 [Bacillus atrophaeus]|nr:hypothetical protein B4144_2139 [Bacillus atrophaeus]